MRVVLALVLASVTAQGLATAIRSQVQSLVGKRLTSSLAIVAKINAVDEDGRNALHHAVMVGDLPLVEFFLANGVNTHAIDNDGLIPLRYAERIATEQPSVSRMQIASLVLEKTRGLNKGDEKGWPPMVWSLMAGDYARVVELRDRGADIFAGRFAYPRKGQLAGRHNPVWAAEHLEDDRAINILAEDAYARYFPVAVNNGYQRFAQAMIARGVDINIKDQYGYSAAMRAAKAGRLKDLQMLIDNGAQLDVGVLLFAIYSGNPKLVETVLGHDVSLANQLAVYRVMYGPMYQPMYHLYREINIDDLLNSATKGGRKIIRMLERANAGIPKPPPALIAKLNELRDTEGRYSSEDNLLKVAVHQGLEQEVQLLLDYLKATPQFIPYVNSVFDITTRGFSPEADASRMLLNNLVGVLNNWQPSPKDQSQLLHTLRIAIKKEHQPAIEAIVDSLDNDGAVVYQELLIGLTIANKTGNDDLARLLLKRAVIADIDKKKIINHSELLKKKLNIHILRRDKNPAGRALVQAIEQDDRETIQKLINYGIKVVDDYTLDLVSYKMNPELFELFVDQIIPFGEISDQAEYYLHGILLVAANSSNFPIIEKVISLGGKSGLDEALLKVAFRKTYTESKTEHAEFEEKVLATMKLLIEAGAKVDVTDGWGRSPLGEAIRSLQRPRVELLLEHGAVSGSIGYDLQHASGTVNLFRDKKGRAVALEYEKNLTEIKQLLVDKGIVQP